MREEKIESLQTDETTCVIVLAGFERQMHLRQIARRESEVRLLMIAALALPILAFVGGFVFAISTIN